jgi:hypothetical protein
MPRKIIIQIRGNCSQSKEKGILYGREENKFRPSKDESIIGKLNYAQELKY